MSITPTTVLLIEDNPGDARLIREVIADAQGVPIELEWADRLSTGLQRLGRKGIDVVLLDLTLPDSQGFETFLKAHEQFPSVPIVVLSGLDDETLAVEAVQKGAQDYLVKGQVDGKTLVRVMRYAIERKRLLQIRDEFVGTVSHELRTPLAITREGISLMLDKIPGAINAQQERILAVARDNIDRLTRIINSLLDISKLEAGRVELARARTDLVALLRRVAASFEPRARERGIDLRVRILDEGLWVYADPDKILQVLVNLVGNAMKFTERGSIEIAARDGEEAVECWVADTGRGIAAEDLPRVFERFQQFGRVEGGGEKGTGLGLAIVKGLIQLHHGTISVASDAGVGTTFTFTLPKYTLQTLLREQLRERIDQAAKDGAGMSLILAAIVERGAENGALPPERRRALIAGVEAVFTSSLRREGDRTMETPNGIAVLLTDCTKEHASRIRARCEGAVARYLEAERASGLVRFVCSSATFPDDARNDEELLERARRAIEPATPEPGGRHGQPDSPHR